MKHWTHWAFKRFGLTLETRWGSDGTQENSWKPYQTILTLGQLRLHCFHRGDGDPDPHDHMWDFWTFPLTSYVEKIWEPPLNGAKLGHISTRPVLAWRVHRRSAELRHLVLSRLDWSVTGYDLHPVYKLPWPTTVTVHRPGRIWTIVWVGPKQREWGFWKIPIVKDLPTLFNEELAEFIPWRKYVYGED